MSSFEFMMVLTSIIIALAMTEILSGIVRILKGELRTWWVHTTYILAGFFGILQLFWDLYSYSDRSTWIFADLLLVLVGPCVLFYLAAALMFPTDRITNTEPIDLEVHYWEIARPFFGVLIPLMPLYMIASIRIEHDLSGSVDVYRSAFLAIYVLLCASRNPTLHKLLAAVHLLLLAVFVASELRALRG